MVNLHRCPSATTLARDDSGPGLGWALLFCRAVSFDNADTRSFRYVYAELRRQEHPNPDSYPWLLECGVLSVKRPPRPTARSPPSCPPNRRVLVSQPDLAPDRAGAFHFNGRLPLAASTPVPTNCRALNGYSSSSSPSSLPVSGFTMWTRLQALHVMAT